MKKIITLLLFALSITACKNENKTVTLTEKENTNTQNTKNSPLALGCYAYDSDGNMVIMEITKMDNGVTGNLDISYAEKDANTGSFIGELKGDTLIGTYTFISEGKKSDREIAFLIKDNQLVEGYGDMNADGTHFEHPEKLDFSSKMPLSKIDCPQ